MDEQQIPGHEPQQPGQQQPAQAQQPAQGQPQAPQGGQPPFAPGLPHHAPGHPYPAAGPYYPAQPAPGAGQPAGHPSAGQPYPGYPTTGRVFPVPGQPYQGQHTAGVPPLQPPTYPPAHWAGQQGWGAAPAQAHRAHQPRLSHGAVAAVTAAALVLGGAAGAGAVFAIQRAVSSDSEQSTAQGGVLPGNGDDGSGDGGSSSGGSGGSGSNGSGGFGPQFGNGNGDGSGGDAQGNGASSQPTTAATASQQRGVVTINAVLGYQNAEAAGTGMILTSDGYVLTNNHVVQGSTSLRVTVESTGKTYQAQVVGTDAAKDVAVIKLTNASGLTPITLDKDGGVHAGDDVTAIGNAEGQGSLVAAAGSVTATNQSMTASTDQGSTGSETLSGLIEFAAAVVSGDSGGALLDSQGEVVGMTTAASSGGTANTVAYAIDIRDAVAVAKRIETGKSGDGIVIGVPAFLGVAFASGSGDTGSGATVQQVLEGTPAARAGIQAGDTITAVDGTSVASADALSSALAAHKPGDKVTITWVSGTSGATQRASVTLMSGPAA